MSNPKTGDGVVRDCQCPIARHEHGTVQAYTADGCRCGRCRAASTAHRDQTRRNAAYGRSTSVLVSSDRARRHIDALRSVGLSPRAIAHAAGLHESIVADLIYGRPRAGRGPTKRIMPATEAAILRVRAVLDNLPPTAYVDVTGTARRLQALAAIGYTRDRLAGMLGTHYKALTRTMAQEKVRAGTARKVRDLYDLLWDQPFHGHDHGTRLSASRARYDARKNGWPPPLAWDEDIDDPTATPYIDTIAA